MGKDFQKKLKNFWPFIFRTSDTIKLMNSRKILLFILAVAALLRLWRINEVPVSLFGDELDVGYHAYSILKTGKDYSGNPWPIHFQSLAEWRTPLYLYSAVPTVAVFGISPLGVRLPAIVFGILGVWALYLLIKEISQDERLALLTSAVLAFSPWHIQYSRAAFEVTLLLFLLLLGLYFFFKSLKNPRILWLSMAILAFTPWVYSTAKLFTPILLVFLLFLYKKDLLSFPKKYLLYGLFALLAVGGPIAYSTLLGGGTQRFGYISIFTDPTTEPEVGFGRLIDARVRGEMGEGLTPTLFDRLVHNKFTFWGANVIKNYFESFSTEFLFIKGDLNLRHSIGLGEFYKIESIALILGLIFLATRFKDKKIKFFLLFWILAGAVPSAITREGGMHATRLILILPPLIFLISYGINETLNTLKGKARLLFVGSYLALFLLGFYSYQHKYWVHYPWESERWWHAGFKEAIQTIKQIDKDYDRVIISTANEPPWIFFAGWYEYPPDKWQSRFPIGNDVELAGFGKVSHIDKFYFGSSQDGLYGLGKVIDNKTLYLAVAKEIGANLIMEPTRTPPELKLIKAIAYPSGEPAFYLFSGTLAQ